DLESVPPDSPAAAFAARALLVDAIRTRDEARARNFAERLHSLSQHTFSDELSCLEAFLALTAFRPALEQVEERAKSEPQWATATGEWLNAHGMAAETLRWFPLLPAATQSNIRVQMAASE